LRGHVWDHRRPCPRLDVPASPRWPARRGGFTLVEALVAGAILTLSASAIGAIVTTAMHCLDKAKEYQVAAELLDRTLTRIDMFGPSRLQLEGPIQGVFAPPHDRFTWKAGISAMSEGHLYDVIVTVSWQTPGGRQGSAQAETLLNDPPDSRPAGLKWEDL